MGGQALHSDSWNYEKTPKTSKTNICNDDMTNQNVPVFAVNTNLSSKSIKTRPLKFQHVLKLRETTILRQTYFRPSC